MGIGGNGVSTLDADIRRQECVDVVKDTLFYNSFVIKVKEVLQRVNASIRPGASGQHNPLPEEDAKSLFDFLLDRVGILLDLKPAV